MIKLNTFIPIVNNEYNKPMLIILNDWSFIKVTGIDSAKYLQTQLTMDIYALNSQEHILTAHCNAKGKIYSTLRLFFYNEGFGYILRNSISKKQLIEIKKYALFSKIMFHQDNNIILLGVIGKGAREILKNIFIKLPNQEKSVIHTKQTTLLHFNLPYERFLIITNIEIATKLTKYINYHGNNQQWLYLDIASGIVNIDIENSELFIPQEVNLQAFPSSISFNKGCYIGQEIIAKVKYHGSNKRSMFYLSGVANVMPKIGESIEWKIGDNWRRTGIILAATILKNNFISIQVVMNNNIHKKSIFRLSKIKNSQLTIQSLPYLLKNSK
ncbi:MAG: tRNA-modifying protein YgfZ [Arsenophonus endosymbiont of Ceratovacuna japonica]